MEPGTRAATLAAVEVPPSIAALLAARLDQLSPGERSLAQRASVMGKSFEQAALAELVPAEPGAARWRATCLRWCARS